MNNLFLNQRPKAIEIVTDDGTNIADSSFFRMESMELREKLCSKEVLKFGCCEAAVISFKTSYVRFSMAGKWLNVSFRMEDGTAYDIGRYKVDSDKPSANRQLRKIEAYDAMLDILTADVITWYNTILPDMESKVTLKQFRDSFFAFLGVEQQQATLPNDSMTIQRTVDADKLSGQTVVTAICEINGCFGHIGRDGKFQYIFLKEMIEGLYPRDDLYPADDLFPSDPKNAETIGSSYYINCEYEDYTTARINKLLIRQEEDDVGAVYPAGEISQSDNCYTVQGNFLVYGKSTEELQTIAANLYETIRRVWYRPAHVVAKGNPCLEVGAGIRLRTKYEIVYTYILQRTLKGIQALRDTYDAEGEQYQRKIDNDVREQIAQLRGKANKLTRTLEETRSEIVDIEKGLSTRIAQNADSIALEAKRATEAEGTLAAQISVNAQNILLKVSKDNIVGEINLSSEVAKIQAAKIDLVGLVNATEFTSKYATITNLNASNVRISSLEGDHVSVGDLNASNGRIGNLEADHVSVSDLVAVNARFNNLNASNITTGTIDGDRVVINNARLHNSTYITGALAFSNRSVKWGQITVGATTYRVLMEDD